MDNAQAAPFEHLYLDDLAQLAGAGRAILVLASRPAYSDWFIGIGHTRTILLLEGQVYITEMSVNLKQAMPDLYEALRQDDLSVWKRRQLLAELRIRGSTASHDHRITTFSYPDQLDTWEDSPKETQTQIHKLLSEHTSSVLAVSLSHEEAVKWIEINGYYHDKEGEIPLYNVLSRHGGISCSTYPLMVTEAVLPGFVEAVGIHNDALGRLALINGVWSCHTRQAARNLAQHMAPVPLEMADGTQATGFAGEIALWGECRDLFIGEVTQSRYSIPYQDQKNGDTPVTVFEVLKQAHTQGALDHFEGIHRSSGYAVPDTTCHAVQAPTSRNLANLLKNKHDSLFLAR